MTYRRLERRRFLLGGAALAASAAAPRASAQCAPVSLPIPNIPQETEVWCWAAVAQQIIVWRRGDSPPQCALVAIANNAPPGLCCSGAPICWQTGSLQQIQFLMAQFGGAYSNIAPPTDPATLYRTLASGRAIIMAVRTSPYAGHVVVLRGMSCFGPTPVLSINDPLGWGPFGQPVPFQQIARFWQAAIVVS